MIRYKVMNVVTEKQKIEEVFERSIVNILPSKESFIQKLLSGERLKIYVGADPTGPKLHIGHATNLILLEKLRLLGHEVIILFGDFTALIGDPTDKESLRKPLNKKEVEENMKTWKEQAGKILDFKDKKNPAIILKNSEWLEKLSFSKIIELSSHFTVQQMIERDMFENRIKNHKPVYLHEFFYPLMQGYDSVSMDIDVEIGGTDQTFNMLIGRTLQKIYNNKEKFVITTKILENPKTGKKLMNKSEGVYIGLNDEPNDMFGKVMALPDEAIIQVFNDSTHATLEEIDSFKKELEGGSNPRTIKTKLAFMIVELFHNKESAESAEKNFESLFQKGEIPEDIEEVSVKKGVLLCDVLLDNGFITSKSEWRRLIDSDAVKDLTKKIKISTVDFIVNENIELRVGKKRFVRLLVK